MKHLSYNSTKFNPQCKSLVTLIAQYILHLFKLKLKWNPAYNFRRNNKGDSQQYLYRNRSTLK